MKSFKRESLIERAALKAFIASPNVSGRYARSVAVAKAMEGLSAPETLIALLNKNGALFSAIYKRVIELQGLAAS